MSIYRPTWLYIKQHNQTGLKYFGKTVSTDPIKYPGSGKYWQRHLKVHGNDVTTVWCQLFTDKSKLQEYALHFSVEQNIVESADWANLKPETGIDGGGSSHVTSDETKKKIGDANRGRKMSKEFCLMRSEKQKGKTPWNKGKVGVQVSSNKGRKFGPPSEEYRKNMSMLLKGKPKPPRTKEHSNKISEAKKGKPSHSQTDESKLKISMKNSGRKAMYNAILRISFKMVSKDRIDEFLSEGWEFGKVRFE